MRTIFLLILAGSLASCASSSGSINPDAAYLIDPLALQAASTAQAGQDYRINPADRLSITVFQVRDLSLEMTRVDAGGDIQMPLIGSVQAAGRSPAELARDIEARLAVRYIRDPRVTVSIIDAAIEKVTVDGAVTEPGVFEMKGRTTLLQAVAMARGASRVSDITNVAVFRTVEDQRMVAVFDLAAIRSGQAEDPVLQGDDVVVVDTSRLSVAMRDVITALPGLAVFAYFK
tara:strand:- start:1494 stop:2186 length:693 start_codon:yes stop_codon:yes gene_type:complete